MAITREQYYAQDRQAKFRCRPVYHNGIMRTVYGAPAFRVVDNTITSTAI